MKQKKAAILKSIQQNPVNRTDYLKAIHHDHLNIYNAIVDQDGLLARQIMRAHLSKSIKKFKL